MTMQKDLGRYLSYFLYKLQKHSFEPKQSRSTLTFAERRGSTRTPEALYMQLSQKLIGIF